MEFTFFAFLLALLQAFMNGDFAELLALFGL